MLPLTTTTAAATVLGQVRRRWRISNVARCTRRSSWRRCRRRWQRRAGRPRRTAPLRDRRHGRGPYSASSIRGVGAADQQLEHDAVRERDHRRDGDRQVRPVHQDDPFDRPACRACCRRAGPLRRADDRPLGLRLVRELRRLEERHRSGPEAGAQRLAHGRGVRRACCRSTSRSRPRPAPACARRSGPSPRACRRSGTRRRPAAGSPALLCAISRMPSGRSRTWPSSPARSPRGRSRSCRRSARRPSRRSRAAPATG